MDKAQWVTALAALERGAQEMLILSRCLDIGPQLESWQSSRDLLPGTDAANALDQAAGMLESLMQGGARALLDQIELVVEALPPAWD